MAQKQIATLTPMRGIAAILVMVHNFDVQEFFLNLSARDYTEFFEKGYLWVDFFFLLSGFVMAHVYGSIFTEKLSVPRYKDFILTRFARIYPLHFFTLSLLVILELSKLVATQIGLFQVNNQPFSDGSLTTLLSNLFLLQAMYLHAETSWNVPSWSISAEWYSYMIFPFFAALLLKGNRYFNTLLFILLFAGISWISISNDGSIASTAQGGFHRCVLSFTIGCLIYRLYDNGLLDRFFRSDLMFLLSITGASLSMHFGLQDHITMVFMILMLCSSACNDGIFKGHLNKRVYVYLGEISYSIYLFHMVFKTYFLSAWRVFSPTEFSSNLTEIQSVFVMFLLVLAVVGCSALIYRYVEKPMRKRIRPQKKNTPRA